MRVAVIAMLMVTILLVAGAGFRLATARASTPALFGISIASKDSAPQSTSYGKASKPAAAAAADAPAADAPETTDAAAPAAPAGSDKQSALVGHLKGNSWEKTEAPAAGDVSEDKQLENAVETTEGREGDLKDAKARIGQIGK